jgi:WD40 repeat protein
VLWQVLPTVNCYCLSFSPDSKLLASGHDVVTYIWDVATGNLVHTIVPSSNTTAIAFSPDGRYLATGGDYIKIWDTQTWDSVNIIKNAGGGIGNMQFTHDGTKLVATAYQACLSIFETTNWSLIKRIDSFPYLTDQHGYGQRSVQFASISHDDKYIAFSSYSGDWTFIYDFALDSIVKQINNSVAAKFSPVRNELVYYYYDSWPAKQNKGLIYYKLDSGDSIYIDINNVNDFAFSSDGDKISIARYAVAQTWSLFDNKAIYSYNNWPADHHHITNSPDGNYIAEEAGYIYLLGAHWTQTGIEPEIISNPIFKAFPNPSNTELEIEFSIQNSETAEIEIVDINGKINKILKSTYFEDGKHNITYNVQDLPNGAYTLRLKHGGKVETQKIMIAR